MQNTETRGWNKLNAGTGEFIAILMKTDFRGQLFPLQLGLYYIIYPRLLFRDYLPLFCRAHSVYLRWLYVQYTVLFGTVSRINYSTQFDTRSTFSESG